VRSRPEVSPSSNPTAKLITGKAISLWEARGRDGWAYLLAFALGFVTIGALVAFHIASMHRQEMDNWKARQSSVAEDRALMVTNWLTERLKDVEQIATGARIREALSQRLRPTRLLTGSAADHGMHAALEETTLPHGCTGLYVVDRDGEEVAHSSTSQPFNPQLVEASRASARADAPRIEVLGRVQAYHLIAFITPVRSGPSKPDGITPPQILGTTIEVLSLSKTLFAMLRSDAVPSKTSETRLVRERGIKSSSSPPPDFVPPVPRTLGSHWPSLPFPRETPWKAVILLKSTPTTAMSRCRSRRGEFL